MLFVKKCTLSTVRSYFHANELVDFSQLLNSSRVEELFYKLWGADLVREFDVAGVGFFRLLWLLNGSSVLVRYISSLGFFRFSNES